MDSNLIIAKMGSNLIVVPNFDVCFLLIKNEIITRFFKKFQIITSQG
jgi:hypothetical protein